jgi:uncharacterized membrane protein
MGRIEVFSDGVIAIAITLLAVELPFDEVGRGGLAHALSSHWPSFAAFLLSFLGLGICWLQHHAMFATLARVDRPTMLINLLLLLAAAFLPFPTSLVGDYVPDGGENARVAVAVWSANWVVLTLAAAWICRHALAGPGLLAPGAERGARRLGRNLAVATGAYIALTALAFLSPVATLAGYALAAAYFLWRSDYAALDRRIVEESA